MKRPAGRVVALANQKGGVGKTTSVTNLATAFAAVDRRSLIIDMDPQGNSSTGLGINIPDRSPGTRELLDGTAAPEETIRETMVPNLDIIPADAQLDTIEQELGSASDGGLRLAGKADAFRSNYADILVDCPPSLNWLTLNALAAADGVIVPLQCEFLPLEGLAHILNTIERVRLDLNPSLSLDGVLLTMLDGRNRLGTEVAADVRRNLKDQVFKTMIPRNVRLAEAPSHGVPALIHDRSCRGSQAYIALAKEILGLPGQAET